MSHGQTSRHPSLTRIPHQKHHPVHYNECVAYLKHPLLILVYKLGMRLGNSSLTSSQHSASKGEAPCRPGRGLELLPRGLIPDFHKRSYI